LSDLQVSDNGPTPQGWATQNLVRWQIQKFDHG
jgi:hypothetical protein